MSDSLDSANRSPDRYLEAATYGFAPNAAPLEAPPQPRRELDAASTRRFADVYRRLVVEIEKAFVGQRELVVGALVALFPAVTFSSKASRVSAKPFSRKRLGARSAVNSAAFSSRRT